MRVWSRILVVLGSIVLIPSITYAQGSIAGIVKDASGAVLPGVTVEAASDVLIEKVRSAVSDANGQYRIEDLRPGTYSVTFVPLPAGFIVSGVLQNVPGAQQLATYQAPNSIIAPSFGTLREIDKPPQHAGPWGCTWTMAFRRFSS